MTIGTLTLVGLTGSLVLLKLALMGFALFLLAQAMFQAGPEPSPAPAPERLTKLPGPTDS